MKDSFEYNLAIRRNSKVNTGKKSCTDTMLARISHFFQNSRKSLMIFSLNDFLAWKSKFETAERIIIPRINYLDVRLKG